MTVPEPPQQSTELLTILNISLALMAAAAAVITFGGETWDKHRKNSSFIRKITVRGWLSLVCLTATAGVATWKELETQRRDHTREAQATAEKTALQKELKETQIALATANTDLTSLTRELAGARTDLTTVQASLSNATAASERQSIASLLSVMSGTEKTIKQIFLLLTVAHPFDKTVNDPRTAVFRALNEPSCENEKGSLKTFVMLTIKNGLNIEYNLDFNSSKDSSNPFISNKLFSFRIMKAKNVGWIHDMSGDPWGTTDTALIIRLTPIKPEPVSSFVPRMLRENAISFAVGGDCVRPANSKSNFFSKIKLVLIIDPDTQETLSIQLKADPLNVSRRIAIMSLRNDGAPQYSTIDLRSDNFPGSGLLGSLPPVTTIK